MRIGVLTGGGDVPGLNPCLRSVTIAARDLGWEVTGFRRGWAGLLAIDPDDARTIALHSRPLDRESVRGIDRAGGTMLHTSRVDPRTVPGGDRTPHVLRVLDALGIDAMVTLGGDGTLRFSAHLSGLGVPVIAIPKTMDNDVFGTDYCIGFATAVSRSVAAINALRTTVESHERIGVIELFGRRSGETALLSGYLAQADRTMISEVPVVLADALPMLVADKRARPAAYAMCVVSEGATIADEPPAEHELAEIAKPATQRAAVGVGQRLALAIEEQTGEGTIVQELAYLMRSGEPDALDRMVGFAFGNLAVQLIQRREHGRMLAISGGRYTHVPAATLLEAEKKVDVDALYDRAAYRPKLVRIEDMPMFLY